MTEPRTFYIWKDNVFSPFSSKVDWRGESYDSWFFYIKSEQTVTKTIFSMQQEVEKHIRKEFKLSSREMPRPKILAAAPQNLSSFKDIQDLEYDQTIKINGLNFDGLMKKDILFVRSLQDNDFENGENLYIDIAYKKILDPNNKDYKSDRKILGDLRRLKLAEYQQKFPEMKFSAAVIDYLTYNLNPACNRTFEELYDDFEEEQMEAGYDAFLDSKYGF